MDYVVSPSGTLSGVAQAPPSKSYTIRAVLSSLLADGKSTVRSPLLSRDTEAAFNACGLFGGLVEKGDDKAVITGCGGKVSVPSSVVDTLNSGTTIRISTAIASLCSGRVTLTGDGSIQRRPIRPLLLALADLGVKSSSANGCPPVTVEGPLRGGSCEIRGDVSSQFITALLMAAPYAKRDVTVNISTKLKSRPYVDLTLNMMRLFGVEVVNEGYSRFKVDSGQNYGAADYTVEGDYSSAAFILAAAALAGSKVTVTNLFSDSLQADRRIVDIIRQMGAKVDVGADRVTVSSAGRLGGVKVDLSDSPDLVPIVSVLGALADGRTEIVNAAHARLKECDRIKAMATELKKMGADITERNDGFSIVGGRLRGARVDGWLDHRVIMSLAVAGLNAEGKTAISGAEHVDVTFPAFKGVMAGLGASLE